MDVLVRLVTLGLVMLAASWGALSVVANVSADGSDGDPHAACAAARDDEPSPLDVHTGDDDDDGDDDDGAPASVDGSRDITTRDVSRSLDHSRDATRDESDHSVSRDVSHDQATGDWSRDDTTSGD